MILSTGKTAFKMEFDNGDTGVIYIDLNDNELFDRLKKFGDNVNAKIKTIDADKYKAVIDTDVKINLNDPLSILEADKDDLNKVIANVEAVKAIEKEYNAAVKEEIDSAFNSRISDVAFKYCEPFSQVIVNNDDGTTKSMFFIEHFVEWFAFEIQKYNEKTSAAMNKHLEKYRK